MKISSEVIKEMMADSRKWHGPGFRLEFRLGYVDGLVVAEIYRRGRDFPSETIAL